MAWNEPGGGNNRDPWSGKGGDQGPPDLDEVVKKLQDKLGGMFGGKRRGGGEGGGGPSFGGGRKAFGGAGVIIGLVLLVVLAIQAFYIIEPAERGVIKRFGAYLEVTEPGPHLKLPFIDEVMTVDVDKVHEFPHRAQMLTKDENIVDLVLSVQYRILDPSDYLFQVADPENSIRGGMESALREVVGRSLLDDITTENRSGIAVEVQTGTQELMDLYRTGLTVLNINIQDAGPPEVVADAFADAIKAREDNVRLQNQAEAYANDVVPRARGAAARIVEDAKAHRAKVVAEAEGESQRFLALLAEYSKAPQVTRERLYLDTLQDVLANSSKVLVDTGAGSSNLTYLPLDKILESAAHRDSNKFASPTAAMPSSSSSSGSDSAPRSRDFNRSGRVR
jgi:membrane protease subunit HflK